MRDMQGKNYHIAQRKYDHELPLDEEENQRVCRCCGEWKDESEFANPRVHICIECEEE